MKKIKLTQGKVALVDDADYEWLNQWKWYYENKKNGKTGYAARVDGNHKIFMHALILGTPVGLKSDHIDLDGLNNQRYNLRICTQAENMRNRGLDKNNKSGYKGVTFDVRSKKWQASLEILGKHISLGCFKDVIDAAKAYDKGAAKYFGKYARLNFP